MKHMALTVYGALSAKADESLHAVGYFDHTESREEREYVYCSQELRERYDEESLLETFEHAFIDSFSAVNYESLHASELHAVTRVYDKTVNTVVPLSDDCGVVFVLERDGVYEYGEIIDSIETAVADERLGVDISE